LLALVPSLVDNAISASADFAYEGHFTNEATWDIPRKFKGCGYRIHLIYLGLADTYLSELRVADRTKSGGHYVDPLTVNANFYGNLDKLDEHFTMFDSVQIIDTSAIMHQHLVSCKSGTITSHISYELFPEWFLRGLPSIAKLVSSRAE
jgi:predicted ABC-type ATPase